MLSEPPPAMPDELPGSTLAGKFEVIDLLGEGAMGRIYRARQIALDKTVAIKVLHRHLAADPKVVKRFHREARAASRLSHPNSLQVIDFGEADDGTLFIAMEYLQGIDLQKLMDRDFPFTPSRIAHLMGQILDALEEAHLAGIVHRDLKPDNVLVLESREIGERVKVCDFGIAKIAESDEGMSALTMSGFVCGTPEYMAPEQARGEELDARADVYAAGVILYQFLTGERPFTADTAIGVISKHLAEAPVPPRVRKPGWGIPRGLDAVAMKALVKDRDQRYATASAMASALKEAVSELGETADVPIGEGRGKLPDHHDPSFTNAPTLAATPAAISSSAPPTRSETLPERTTAPTPIATSIPPRHSGAMTIRARNKIMVAGVLSALAIAAIVYMLTSNAGAPPPATVAPMRILDPSSLPQPPAPHFVAPPAPLAVDAGIDASAPARASAKRAPIRPRPNATKIAPANSAQ
jgi:serine/threonine protein kinase